jgi:hypothetical protein
VRAHQTTDEQAQCTAVAARTGRPAELLAAADPAVVHAMAVLAGWSDTQRLEFIRTVYRYGYAYLRARDRHLLIQLVNSVLAAVVLHTHPDYLRAIHAPDRPPTTSTESPSASVSRSQTGEVC